MVRKDHGTVIRSERMDKSKKRYRYICQGGRESCQWSVANYGSWFTVQSSKLVQHIEAAIKESEPDIIITHHPADTNNDHLQTSMACQEAIRLFQRRPEVKPIQEFWYMEVPSCTEWALNTAMNRFQPNTWVEVGKEGVDAKVKALSMYRGVMRPYPHPRSAEAIEGFAAYRGCQTGCVYAEAFEVALRRI